MAHIVKIDNGAGVKNGACVILASDGNGKPYQSDVDNIPDTDITAYDNAYDNRLNTAIELVISVSG